MDDTDLARRLDRSIGPAPDSEPALADLLAAGHQVVRRRRITAGVGSVLAGAAAVVAVAISTSGSPERAQAPIATEPTATASQTPAPAEETETPEPTRREINQVLRKSRVDYDQQCRLKIGEGSVLQRVDDPYDMVAQGGESIAVELQVGAGVYWYVSTCDAAGGGSNSWTYGPDARTASFEAWIDEMAPIPGDRGGDGPFVGIPDLDLVAFDGDTETLAPVAGVTILDQRAGVDVGADFAAPGERTAAAKVSDASGAIYFVLARASEAAEPQYIAVPEADVDGGDLDDFLDLARQAYEGEGGLL